MLLLFLTRSKIESRSYTGLDKASTSKTHYLNGFVIFRTIAFFERALRPLSNVILISIFSPRFGEEGLYYLHNGFIELLQVGFISELFFEYYSLIILFAAEIHK